MSNAVDQRIVEMQFDNAQFERGIASTLESLKSFEQGLSFKDGISGIQGVQEAVKSIDFSVAENGVSSLGGALEGLKSTALNAFEGITSGIGTLVKGYSLVKGLFTAGVGALAVTGGWSRASNLNKAAFKLDSMGIGWSRVSQQVSNAVDGTAYSLDAAATAASLFASSGVEIEGVGDRMEQSLKAVANIASVSGSSFEEISNIFAKVAAQGKLTGMQMTSLSLAGVQASEIIGEYLKVGKEELDELQRKGLISFDQMVDAFNAKYGEAAGMANNSFDGAMANMRSALSRTLADFFQNYQQAMIPMFNAVRLSINTINTTLKPLLGMTWERILPDGTKVKQMGVLLEATKGIIEQAAKAVKIWGGSEKLADGTVRYYSQAFNRFKRIFEGVAEAIEGPLKEIEAGTYDLVYGLIEIGATTREFIRLAGEALLPVGQAFFDLFGGGAFADATRRFHHGIENILDTIAEFHIAEGVVNAIHAAFILFFSGVKTVGNAAFEAIGGAVNGLFDILLSVGSAIGGMFDSAFAVFEKTKDMQSTFTEFFKPLLEATKDIPALHELVAWLSKLPTFAERLSNALQGKEGSFELLARFMRYTNTKFGKVGKFVGEGFKSIADGVASFIDRLRNGGISEVMGRLGNLQGIGEGLYKFFSRVKDVLFGFGDRVVSKLGESGFLDAFSVYFRRVSQAFSDFFSGDSLKFLNFDYLAERLKGITDVFTSIDLANVDFTSNPVLAAVGAIGDLVSQVGDIGAGGIRKLQDFFSNLAPILEPLKGFGRALSAAFADFFSGNDFQFLNIDVLSERITAAFSQLFSRVGSSISVDANSGPIAMVIGLITNIGSKIREIGSSGISGITNFFSQLDFSSIANFIKSLVSSFSGISDSAVDKASSVVDKSTGVVGNVIEKLKGVINGPLGTLKGFTSNPFKVLGEFAGGFVNSITNLVSSFVGSLDLDSIKQFASVVTAIGISIGGIVALKAIGDGIKSVGSFFEGIGGIGKSISKGIDALSGAMDQVKKNLGAARVRIFAESIAILAGSLAGLALIGPDKLMAVLPVFAIITAIVTAMGILFGKLAKSDSFDFSALEQVGAAIGSLGDVLGKLMSSILIFSAIASIGDVTPGILALAAIGIALGVLMSKFSKLDAASMESSAGVISAIDGLIGSIMAAVAVLGMMDVGSLGKAIGALGLLMLFFGLLVRSMSRADALKSSGSQMLGLSKVFSSMSAMLLAAAVSIRLLGGMSLASLAKGTIAVGAIMALAYLMAKGLSRMDEFGMNKGKIAQIAAVMLAMSVAIVGFAAAVAIVSAVSMLGGDILSSMLAIAGGIIAIGAAVALIGAFGANLASASAALIAFTAVVAVFTIGILALSLVPYDTIMTGINNIIPILVTLGVSLLAIGLLGSFLGKGFIAIAAAFLIVSAGVLVLSVALLAVAGSLAIVGAVGPAAAVALEQIFKVLTEALGSGIDAVALLGLSVALISFGAACIVLGVGLGLLALTIPAAVSAFDSLVKYASELSQSLTSSMNDTSKSLESGRSAISNGMYNALLGIADGFARFIGGIPGYAISLMHSISGALSSNSGLIRTGAQEIVKTMGDVLYVGIFELLPAIGEALKGLGLGLLEGLADAMTGPVNAFNQFLYENFGDIGLGVAPVAEQSGEQIVQGLDEGLSKEDMLGSVNEKMEEARARLDEKFGELSETGSAGAESFTGSIADAMSGVDFMQLFQLDNETLSGGFEAVKEHLNGLGIEAPDSLVEGLTSGASNIDLANIIETSGNMDMSSLNDLASQAGIELPVEFGSGVEQGMASVDITGILTGTQAIDTEAITGQFTEAGTTAANAFTTSFGEAASNIDSGILDKAVSAVNKPAKFQTSGTADGKAVVTGVKTGMSNLVTIVKTTVGNAVSSAKSYTGEASSGGREVGSSFGSGMYGGMSSWIGPIAEAAAQMVRNAKARAKAEQHSNSPSKDTMRYGMWFGQGYESGIEQMIDRVGNVSGKMVDAAKKPLTLLSAEDMLSSLFINDNPVITPVLDLSEYELGIRRMNGLNTSVPTISAQLANRIGSGSSYGEGYYNKSNTVNVNLYYGAGTTAADMVNEMAMVLQTKNLMEA